MPESVHNVIHTKRGSRTARFSHSAVCAKYGSRIALFAHGAVCAQRGSRTVRFAYKVVLIIARLAKSAVLRSAPFGSLT